MEERGLPLRVHDAFKLGFRGGLLRNWRRGESLHGRLEWLQTDRRTFGRRYGRRSSGKTVENGRTTSGHMSGR
ncbi:hypothetical protein Dsin_004393 [Dipteronia sinensis]|uniref:Uncharacterized protein n=1 Tax=Dipteronia sinensis TaxID=43782 RepID=A0AAE0BAW9_9ROSI|nr:hypothetical protein Dsin_004393 [Dipteronia sinensis]